MESYRAIPRRRAVTLQEVANAAGVSSSAASVILNGAKSGTRVSKETQKNVLEVANRMGYRPHAVAQSLATGRTNRVGFYSGRSRLDCRNLFCAEILGGVFEGAEELGLDTIIHTSGRSEGRMAGLVRGQTMDGLIIYASQGDPILALLSDLLIPAVAIADEVKGIPSVVVDDWEGGKLLAQHLAALKHRHVLIKQSPQPPPSAISRVTSFSQTCVQLGVKVTLGEESWNGDALNPSDFRVLTEGPGKATAVMAWSDAVAETVCESLEKADLRVPEDIAVVGFDGFPYQNAPLFDLTTIRAPWNEVGREAVRLLARLIAGESVPPVTKLPVTFYQGDTT